MTALITGASGGIGGMCAYRAIRKGYDVALVFHQNETACHKLAQDLTALSGKAKCFTADITRADDRKRLVGAVREQLGEISLLINNAGISLYGTLQDCSEADIERLISTDLTAQILLTRLVLPDMIRAGKGSIVNISSIWGLTGASCEVAYSAAKAGLIGFTKALAKEVAPAGVRVNAVAPGVVDTPMLARFSETEMQAMREDIPLGRFGDALEIADSVLFLAEQEFITGQVLSPNGGAVI